MDIFWIVVGDEGYILAASGWLWKMVGIFWWGGRVVDIFWLVVGGGGYILDGGGWWLMLVSGCGRLWMVMNGGGWWHSLV